MLKYIITFLVFFAVHMQSQCQMQIADFSHIRFKLHDGWGEPFKSHNTFMFNVTRENDLIWLSGEDTKFYYVPHGTEVVRNIDGEFIIRLNMISTEDSSKISVIRTIHGSKIHIVTIKINDDMFVRFYN